MNILIILIELYKQLKEETLLIILYLVHILEQWWGEGDKNLANGKAWIQTLAKCQDGQETFLIILMCFILKLE